MTVFKNNVNPSEDNQQEESINSYLEVLVGDGKKFKDLEALARAKWEADKHIARLEAERAADRKEMESRLNLEELVSKLTSRTADTSNSDTQTQNERQEENSLKETDIAALVEQTIERKQLERSKQANIQTVSEELRKAWGPNYVEKLKAKAKELELSESFIDDAAAKSPKAVLSLLLAGEKKVEQDTTTSMFAPPKSSVNTTGMSSKTTSNALKEHYSKMRRENPKKYFSPEVHAEMLKLVEEGKLEF